MRWTLILSILLLSLLAAACSPPPVPETSAAIRVAVSILPQAYFVERIGGDLVTVDVLVGPGQSPATYEPTPKQMADLGRADLLVTCGVPFERSLLPKITAILPQLTIVDGTAGIELQPMPDHHDHDEHGEDEGHEHGLLDPHFWLDPQLVAVHAATICDQLVLRAPDHAEELHANLARLSAELSAIDTRIATRLAPFQGRSMLVFHPAYGYFARRYGLHQLAVEAGGKEPSARQLAQLIDQLRDTGTTVIFAQPQYSTRSAEVVAEAINGTVVPLDPLASDYLANLELMAGRVAEAYQP
jgi:zinc transport system substrate-binding protein